jgi:hypothetical protein
MYISCHYEQKHKWSITPLLLSVCLLVCLFVCLSLLHLFSFSLFLFLVRRLYYNALLIHTHTHTHLLSLLRVCVYIEKYKENILSLHLVCCFSFYTNVRISRFIVTHTEHVG